MSLPEGQCGSDPETRSLPLPDPLPEVGETRDLFEGLLLLSSCSGVFYGAVSIPAMVASPEGMTGLCAA